MEGRGVVRVSFLMGSWVPSPGQLCSLVSPWSAALPVSLVGKSLSEGLNSFCSGDSKES